MNFESALEKLKSERVLYTDMLEPLNIGFEFFLKLGQMDKEDRAKVINRLISRFELERAKQGEKK